MHSPFTNANATEKLAPAALQHLAMLFATSLQTLGFQASNRQLEHWSVLIHETMSRHGRSFHTVDHVFDLADNVGALEALAAIFHDAVYHQVDGGLPGQLQAHLADVIETQDDTIRLAPFNADDDPLRALTIDLFGFKPQQELSPYGGLNEFLSALLALRVLSSLLPMPVLAKIAACIEGTIPFRSHAPDGEDVSESLLERLRKANVRFNLGLSEQGLVDTLHSAVALANRDVSNFASDDSAHFLDNTWMLLPETNGSLRPGNVYTVREYRIAIQRMEGFLRSLKPERVFRTFRGRPGPEELARITEKAAFNLRIACSYLRAKLITAYFIEAVADLTGGDAPIALFMGDLPHRTRVRSIRFEDYLPAEPSIQADDTLSDVHRLLSEGRAREVGFDLKNSPLASFFYRGLGESGMAHAADALREPEEVRLSILVERIPFQLREAVVEIFAKIALTRADDLRALIENWRTTSSDS